MMPPVQMRSARSSKAARRFAAMPGSFLLGEITQRVGSGVPLGAGGVPRFFPFGHPPFFALRRAALALASEVARPPRRPSACAALFIDLLKFEAALAQKCLVRHILAEDLGSLLPVSGELEMVSAVLARIAGCNGAILAGFCAADDVGFHFGFWLLVGLISFDGGDNSETLGYCKRKVKNLLGGGGGSKNLPSALAKKNSKINKQEAD